MARKRGAQPQQHQQRRDSSNKQQQLVRNGRPAPSNDFSSDSRSSSVSKYRRLPQSSSSERNGKQSGATYNPCLADTKLSEKDYDILLLNSLYDKSQIDSWLLAYLRDCPTGRLDKQQLSDAFTCTYGEKKRNHFVSMTFRAFDPSNTGAIDFVSFLLALSLASPSAADDKFKMIFAYFENRLLGAMDGNHLSKELTFLVQIVYDLVDEENRSNQRSPKWRVQRILRDCTNGKSGGKKFEMLGELLKACLADDVLMEVAGKSIIAAQ